MLKSKIFKISKNVLRSSILQRNLFIQTVQYCYVNQYNNLATNMNIQNYQQKIQTQQLIKSLNQYQTLSLKYFSTSNDKQQKEELNNKNNDKKQENSDKSDKKAQEQNPPTNIFSSVFNKIKNSKFFEKPVQENNQKPEQKNTKEEDKSAQKPNKQEEIKQEQSKDQQQENAKLTFRENLEKTHPYASKVLEFIIYAWQETFPNDKYKKKFQKIKEDAKIQKKKEEELSKLSEEDLAKLEENIPEWKKNQLVLQKQIQEKESLKKQLANKFKNKFNQTSFAKQIYESDKYKEFEKLKNEIKEFKHDFKEYVENSQSPLVQATLQIKGSIQNESSTAKAINEMKKFQPDFDVWELEDDSKGIFEAAYTTFLQGNLELLSKMCGEVALAYFKVLLKKNEADKCEPKYKYLWNLERAQFLGAKIAQGQLPVFMFRIECQQIYCMISTAPIKESKDGEQIPQQKIVDGSDDRLLRYEYDFAITPHPEPDLESVGHAWQMIEVQPRQIVKLLV